MRKDPTEFRERFKKWKETGEYELPRFEDGYESFLATLPDNQKKPGAYNTRRYWELNGKPKNFAEAIGLGMYTFENDNAWHANSVAYNDKNDTYEFMKPNYHETRWMELVYGYDKDPEFLKEWKVKYNGPMLSDRYVRREKPGLKVKGGLLPKFEEGAEPDYQLSSDFISQYEGWSDTAYQKKGDVPTIGYGTTNPKWVSKGRITKTQGIQAMHEDLAANEPLLRKNIKDYDRLPDTAKTVLRDILYNVGQGNMFRKSPKFIDAMNAGNYEEAARQMDWDENKSGFGGAKVRNQARREMFLLDLKKNPVKPRSQLVQLMYDKPEFQSGFQYMPTTLTDYSLTNRAGGNLNAWDGAGSPSYGGATVRIPSLYLTIEQNTFVPRKKHRQ